MDAEICADLIKAIRSKISFHWDDIQDSYKLGEELVRLKAPREQLDIIRRECQELLKTIAPTAPRQTERDDYLGDVAPAGDGQFQMGNDIFVIRDILGIDAESKQRVGSHDSIIVHATKANGSEDCAIKIFPPVTRMQYRTFMTGGHRDSSASPIMMRYWREFSALDEMTRRQNPNVVQFLGKGAISAEQLSKCLAAFPIAATHVVDVVRAASAPGSASAAAAAAASAAVGASAFDAPGGPLSADDVGGRRTFVLGDYVFPAVRMRRADSTLRTRCTEYLLEARTNKTLARENLRRLFRGILTAVAGIHAAKLVWCDIKPDNFLTYTPAGASIPTVIGIDYECAVPPKTHTVGTTNAFRPPEYFKLKDGEHFLASEALDMWCLGVTVLVCLSTTAYNRILDPAPGEENKDANSAQRVLRVYADPHVRGELSRIDGSFESLTSEMLQENPAQRLTLQLLLTSPLARQPLSTTDRGLAGSSADMAATLQQMHQLLVGIDGKVDDIKDSIGHVRAAA